jgi:AcrR family transcriptional regulator
MTTPTRARRVGGLRTTLIKEGLRLGRTGGVAALGLREITRSVGVSANAAYRHFADHDALLVAVAVEARSLLAHHIIDRMTGDATPSNAPRRPDQRVLSFGLGYIDFALSEPGWLDLACYSHHASPDVLPELADGDPPPPPHVLLVAALDDMLASGALMDDQRPDAEWTVWSAIEGFTQLATSGPLQGSDRERLDLLARRVLETTVRALTQESAPSLGRVSTATD